VLNVAVDVRLVSQQKDVSAPVHHARLLVLRRPSNG
jgi:hypothetical protein